MDRVLVANDDTYKLLQHLDLANSPKVGQESAIENFVARLLIRGTREDAESFSITRPFP